MRNDIGSIGRKYGKYERRGGVPSLMKILTGPLFCCHFGTKQEL